MAGIQHRAAAAMISGTKRAIGRLRERLNDPKVQMIGAAEDLALIAAALEEIEARQEVLASVLLAKHYGWAQVPEPLWDTLRELGEERYQSATRGAYGEKK